MLEALAKKEREAQERLQELYRRKQAMKNAHMKAQMARLAALKQRQEQIAKEREEARQKLQEKMKLVEQRREEMRKRIKEMRSLSLTKMELPQKTQPAKKEFQGKPFQFHINWSSTNLKKKYDFIFQQGCSSR